MGEVEYDGQGSFMKFVVAGALAGTAEHCGMFPVDTVKTHLQAVRPSAAAMKATGGHAPDTASAPSHGSPAPHQQQQTQSQPQSTTRKHGPLAPDRRAGPLHSGLASGRSLKGHASGGVAPGGVGGPGPAGGATVARGMVINAQAAAQSLIDESMSAMRAAQVLYRRRGVPGFFRGMSAVLWGAAPSHAVYFSAYELAKIQLNADDPHEHRPMATAAAGIIATMTADVLHVPMDTVKQRMQLHSKPYRHAWDCVVAVVRSEGVGALWRSYTTTLVMNIPFSATYFASYESFVKLYYSAPRLTRADYEPVAHWLAGASAGAIAAATTNPLDVAKTRLQTQGQLLTGPNARPYTGMTNTLKTILREEGGRAFFLGVGPRMLFHSTASAITWSVYEFVKYKLG